MELLYSPQQWRDESDNFFAANANWLIPPVDKVINGHQDAFSQQYVHVLPSVYGLLRTASRLGQECQPEGFPSTPPSEVLFDPKKVVIVNNGRCASSCALFTVRYVLGRLPDVLNPVYRSPWQRRKELRLWSSAVGRVSSKHTLGRSEDSPLTFRRLIRRLKFVFRNLAFKFTLIHHLLRRANSKPTH